MERISAFVSSFSLSRYISRMFSPTPGRGMEVTHPVTCTVELEGISDTSILQPGDTVTVDGDAALCRHVGVYLGNDEVIDFTNELKKTTLASFTGGAQPLSRVHYSSPQQIDKPEVIMKRALDALENPEMVGSYNIISNNSEHFVTYCTFGTQLSYEGIKAEKGKEDVKAEKEETKAKATDSRSNVV